MRKQFCTLIAASLIPWVCVASVVFQDDFNGAALDGTKWRQLAYHGQTATPTGSTMVFNSQNYADTCAKFAFSGSGGIVIEARMRGPGTNRDVTVQIVEAVSGDTIASGDTTYFGGMYLSGSGQFSSPPAFGGASTALFKEYRLSIAGATATLARGDSLSSLTETFSMALGSSVEGKSFYLKIGAGGPLYFPSEFDWIRVNGVRVPNTAICPTAGLIGTSVDLVTPSTAVVDQPTLFSVFGGNLTAGLGFTLGDCTPADSEVFDATTSDTLRKFRCTPRGSPGLKYGRIKTSPTGTTLANFTVDVVANPGANEVTSFVFDGPISDQQTGQPFSIHVRAVNSNGATVSGFNGMVRLADEFGKTLSQSSLTFANGSFSGDLIVLAAGRARLSIGYTIPSGSTVTGISDGFNVGTAETRQHAVAVKIGVIGAEVKLNSGVTNTATATTDASGDVVVSSVPSGSYRLVVTKTGWKQTNYVAQDIVIDKNRTISVEMTPTGKRPVLIVPGVMGSTLKASAYSSNNVIAPRSFGDHLVGVSPKLPLLKCDVSTVCKLADDLEIYDPTIGRILWLYKPKHSDDTAMGSKLLIDTLTPQFAVFPTPWDWRHNIEEAWKIYLKPRIDAVKAATGYSKVDVVAHSMGGLVTRAYIQDASYSGDIDRFIMLGTPNRGSANAYYLMEGGQALELDSAVGSLSSKATLNKPSKSAR